MTSIGIEASGCVKAKLKAVANTHSVMEQSDTRRVLLHFLQYYNEINDYSSVEELICSTEPFITSSLILFNYIRLNLEAILVHEINLRRNRNVFRFGRSSPHIYAGNK